MGKLPENNLQDEAEMRAFYERCGVSKSTTEAALKLRRQREDKKPSPLKGRRRKADR
jgi:hypothetical protein